VFFSALHHCYATTAPHHRHCCPRRTACIACNYTLRRSALLHCRCVATSRVLRVQGDFVSHLMETVAPELDKPASQQLTHNLIGFLEGALRATNAQFDDRMILDRIDLQVNVDQSTNPGASILHHASGSGGFRFCKLASGCGTIGRVCVCSKRR
jgi:hypothetical protein